MRGSPSGWPRAARRSPVSRPGRHHCVRVLATYAAAGRRMPTVLVADRLGEAGMDLLRLSCHVEAVYGMSHEQLCERVAGADALIVRSGTKVTRTVFEASRGRLKVVGRAGVGVDNVDLAAATEYGCLVVNAPTANTVAAAEHGIALLCALARNIPQADASVKAGRWDRGAFMGASLLGKTLAIYGFGKVGLEVARRARGLCMHVVAYDPYASSEAAAAQGVRLVTFDEALALGDFHSLHMPLTPGTKGIFGPTAFSKIKPGSRLINVARGGVIDEAALLAALQGRRVAAAALDVFADEPPHFDGHPLLRRPDVICTPHLGASTTEAQEGVALEVVEAVVDALSGRLSPNAVNAPMVPPEILRELQPYIVLAEALGRAAIGLVGEPAAAAAAAAQRQQQEQDAQHRAAAARGAAAAAWQEAGEAASPPPGPAPSFAAASSSASPGFTDAASASPHSWGPAGFTDVSITYSSPRGDDLDTRLLRAMVIKGVLEGVTTARVNLVNADLQARARGLRITEVHVRSGEEGTGEVLRSMSVALGTDKSKFSASVDRTGRIYVEGKVFGGQPFLTAIGNYDVELGVGGGAVLLTRQRDQPGIVGGVGMLLAADMINISYMTVSRTRGGEAIMAIGIDSEPSPDSLAAINQVPGVIECALFREAPPPT